METLEKIKAQIADNPILLYMKGSPERPQCGFSAHAVQALNECGMPFAHVDVLENPDIRRELPPHAKWPTFPQLWVKGQLIGGCDIMRDLHQSGELKKMLSKTKESNE